MDNALNKETLILKVCDLKCDFLQACLIFSNCCSGMKSGLCVHFVSFLFPGTYE